MSKGLMATAKGRALCIAGFFALAAFAGFVMGAVRNAGEGTFGAGVGLIWLALPLALVVAAGSLWFGAVWMKSIDEAAQEAHKWAWYWGGSTGMAVAMVGFLLAFMPQSTGWTLPTIGGRTDAVAYAVTGGGFVIVLMLAGYSLAWALWWFQRR